MSLSREHNRRPSPQEKMAEKVDVALKVLVVVGEVAAHFEEGIDPLASNPTDNAVLFVDSAHQYAEFMQRYLTEGRKIALGESSETTLEALDQEYESLNILTRAQNITKGIIDVAVIREAFQARWSGFAGLQLNDLVKAVAEAKLAIYRISQSNSGN